MPFKALVIGVSQTGKSTFALHLALASGKQTVIWDANEVFSDIVPSPVLVPDDLRHALDKGEPVVVYDAINQADRVQAFEQFARVLEDYDFHTLLIDEAGDIQKASSPNPGLDRLYRRSGRRGNDIIETTHKPSQVATLNRSLTTDVYLFGISRGIDIDTIGREFSPDAALEASHLPDYVYIHWHARSGEWEKVDDPASWYIPLDRLLPEMDREKTERRKRRPLFWEGA